MTEILATTAGEDLAKAICAKSDGAVTLIHTERKNGEVYPRTYYILFQQGLVGNTDWNINDTVIETMLLLDACKRADVSAPISLTLDLTKRRPREPIVK